ncbi:hypothetical protein LZC95_31935 [Pendulispora brunnea]|uniref:PBP domain-containing protein n=1 Tax=Pendulispora brunnea TaxID=2905690 RepID=A0ABZ2JX41_9BACT
MKRAPSALLLALFLAGCNTGNADSAESSAGPTAEDVKDATKEIAPIFDRSKVTVQVVPGGTGGSADMNGGFQSAMLARINPDGTVSQACVESESQAEAFFSANIGIKLNLKRKE